MSSEEATAIPTTPKKTRVRDPKLSSPSIPKSKTTPEEEFPNHPPVVNRTAKGGGQSGLRGSLIAQAASLSEDEAVARLPTETRDFIQMYVETGKAKESFITAFSLNPDEVKRVSDKAHRCLAQPLHASYVKLLRMRAADHSILSLEELARWLSTSVLDPTQSKSDALKAADQLAKLTGYNAPKQSQTQNTTEGQVTHEVIMTLATPPALEDLTTETDVLEIEEIHEIQKDIE